MKHSSALSDEIWGLLKETQKNLKEVSASQKEGKREMEEIRASQKETARQIKEFHASQKKTDQQIQKIGGRFNQRWGALVESLVEGKLVRIFRDQGIDITQTYTRSTGEWRKPDGPQIREFDIIAANGIEAVIVEVKTVLTPKDLSHFIQTLKDFHHYLTRFKSEKIYGAVAYLSSEGKAHLMAEEAGLFIIRATGDSASLANKKGFKPKPFLIPIDSK